MVLLALALPLVALALAPRQGLAQGGGGEEGRPPVREVTDDEVNAVSRELYCPVCENEPLDVCGTAACERWRAQVRTMLEQGASREEVINYFVEQFGQRVVATPRDPVLNLLSWAVPAAAVVLGLVIVGVVLVRWRFGSRAGHPAEEIAQEDDDYRARLERELRMWE